MDGTPVFEQNLNDHAKYEAKLLLGGPFLDNSGGLAILIAENLNQANAIEKQDPAFTEGVMVPHIHEWYVIFNQKGAK